MNNHYTYPNCKTGTHVEEAEWIPDEKIPELLHCSACGYIDHRTTNDYCPACGRKMKQAHKETELHQCPNCKTDAYVEEAEWIPDEKIPELLHCSACGYIDHRTTNDYCPACGRKVNYPPPKGSGLPHRGIIMKQAHKETELHQCPNCKTDAYVYYV